MSAFIFMRFGLGAGRVIRLVSEEIYIHPHYGNVAGIDPLNNSPTEGHHDCEVDDFELVLGCNVDGPLVGKIASTNMSRIQGSPQDSENFCDDFFSSNNEYY
uniref:Uncharacterized protein n=1 Tax=Leptocylindrus danicus TaxID=163516 RepID=A0A7S2LFE6_9STRA|mmetsp:Transcript_4708/g.6868  ORF Transcript_4708/g.6868 Transcript_4708/m.6868 type:complete len:102 (+) Transcript_4708:16-321(+)